VMSDFFSRLHSSSHPGNYFVTKKKNGEGNNKVRKRKKKESEHAEITRRMDVALGAFRADLFFNQWDQFLEGGINGEGIALTKKEMGEIVKGKWI